jgi:hypothetical protein
MEAENIHSTQGISSHLAKPSIFSSVPSRSPLPRPLPRRPRHSSHPRPLLSLHSRLFSCQLPSSQVNARMKLTTLSLSSSHSSPTSHHSSQPNTTVSPPLRTTTWVVASSRGILGYCPVISLLSTQDGREGKSYLTQVQLLNLVLSSPLHAK